MLRIRIPTAALAALIALAAPARAQGPTLDLPRVSQHSKVSQTIGITELSVDYHRPGVKGRAIWGALVPWNEPWRTGANEATRFTCSGDIRVEGQPLPAGTYALVTIPGANGWTVAFSRQKEMWGAVAYDPAQDQLRVQVSAQAAEPTEWMQFSFEDLSAESATLALRWEKLRVPVRLSVDVNAQVLAGARSVVAAAAADDWRTPYRAANWAHDAGIATDETAAWGARALQAKENLYTLGLAAKVEARTGRKDEAMKKLTRAISLGKADKDVNADQLATWEKMLGEWKSAGAAEKAKGSNRH